MAKTTINVTEELLLKLIPKLSKIYNLPAEIRKKYRIYVTELPGYRYSSEVKRWWNPLGNGWYYRWQSRNTLLIAKDLGYKRGILQYSMDRRAIPAILSL